MKQKGRQHGMGRTYPILPVPRPKATHFHESSPRPTVNQFTKVPIEPTNHSELTRKCGRPKCRRCYINSACQHKDKAKGAPKLTSKSSHVGSDYRLNTRRLVDARPGLKLCGFSTASVLDHLATIHYVDYDCDEDEQEYDGY